MLHAMSENPLLTVHTGLPRFDLIRAAEVEPALNQHLDAVEAGMAKLERDLTPTWGGLVAPLAELMEPLGAAWAVVNHLMAVANSPELRAAHAAVLPRAVGVFLRAAQSVPLYKGMKALRDSAAWADLDDAQRRIVGAGIRDAQLAGVGLEGAALERVLRHRAGAGRAVDRVLQSSARFDQGLLAHLDDA